MQVDRETLAKLKAIAFLVEEFLDRRWNEHPVRPAFEATEEHLFLHGHCHQKAFDAFTPVMKVLRLIPDLDVSVIESSCCGMAGAFGYGADTYDASMQMAELSLLPAVRGAEAGTLIVADGTSCRHQIKDGADRSALHVARVLALSLDNTQANP